MAQTCLDLGSHIKAPAEYVSAYREKLGEEGYAKSCRDNALPLDFEKLEYPDFLAQRRVLMANIVKKAYEKLCE